MGNFNGGVPRMGEHRITSQLYFDKYADLSNLAFGGTGASAPTVIADSSGGGILLSMGSSNDNAIVAATTEIFRLNQKNAWYAVQFGITFSHATDMDIIMGLFAGAITTPTATLTDAVVLTKADDATGFSFTSNKNAAGSTSTSGMPTNDTLFHLWRIGIKTSPTTLGIGDIHVWRDGIKLYQADGAVICDDEEMKVVVGIQNGSANARTATLYSMEWDMPNPRRIAG